jgi:uncharacterized coiled-coil protein SlyX
VRSERFVSFDSLERSAREFLKGHRNVAEQESTIAELNRTLAQQQKKIEALTATVQKVSDQVALSRPVPQLVANHQIASSYRI